MMQAFKILSFVLLGFLCFWFEPAFARSSARLKTNEKQDFNLESIVSLEDSVTAEGLKDLIFPYLIPDLNLIIQSYVGIKELKSSEVLLILNQGLGYRNASFDLSDLHLRVSLRDALERVNELKRNIYLQDLEIRARLNPHPMAIRLAGFVRSSNLSTNVLHAEIAVSLAQTFLMVEKTSKISSALGHILDDLKRFKNDLKNKHDVRETEIIEFSEKLDQISLWIQSKKDKIDLELVSLREILSLGLGFKNPTAILGVQMGPFEYEIKNAKLLITEEVTHRAIHQSVELCDLSHKSKSEIESEMYQLGLHPSRLHPRYAAAACIVGQCAFQAVKDYNGAIHQYRMIQEVLSQRMVLIYSFFRDGYYSDMDQASIVQMFKSLKTEIALSLTIEAVFQIARLDLERLHQVGYYSIYTDKNR